MSHKTTIGSGYKLEPLRDLESLFHSALQLDQYVEGLTTYLNKNGFNWGAPIAEPQLRQIDQFTKDYFLGQFETTRMWLIRGFVLGKLVQISDSTGLKVAETGKIKIAQLDVDGALKKYALTGKETRAIKWMESDGARDLSAATGEMVARVQAVISDGIKTRQTYSEIKRALELEMSDDAKEINRNWKRVAITEINRAYNTGYLATLGGGSFVVGSSASDACEECLRDINDKIFAVIEPGDVPSYSNLDPKTKAYKDAEWIWEKCMWTGKDNVGRSRAARKRVNDMLIDRSHHEKSMPAVPYHPYCRCVLIKITENQFLSKDGKIKPKFLDPKAWEAWTKDKIQPLKDGIQTHITPGGTR